MEVRLGVISRFDATDAEEVIRNLRNPGVLARSHPSKIVARWKRYVRPDLFRVYFFDDLQQNPAELRRSILCFLGADPDKPSGRLNADYNGQGGREKLRYMGAHFIGQPKFFKDELRACARELGGPAREGQPDMASHCSGSSSGLSAMICFFGGTGSSEPWQADAISGPRPRSGNRRAMISA
jgi:hypothetical protein